MALPAVLSGMCRACLGTSQNLEPLSTEYEAGYSLKDMLTSFCTIHLDENATSSSNLICKECSLETLRAYNFKLKCERSDGILRDRAQILKEEDGYIFLESQDLREILKNVNVDISIVKDEDQDDDAFCDADVKYEDEDYVMDVEGLDETDEDEILNDIIKKQKKKKSTKKSKVAVAVRKDVNEGEQKKTGRPGRKKKPVSAEKAKVIDNSHLELGYKRVYECPKCSTLCKSFKMMYKHLLSLHGIDLNGVGEFDFLRDEERKKKGIETVEEKKDVVEANASGGNNQQYKCVDCEYRNKNYKAMKKHILGHREEKYMHCDECKFRTKDLRRLVRHVKSMHRDERRYTCECGYRADSKFAMDMHHTTKHLKIKPFVCHLCAKEFTTNQGMMIHIASRHEKQRNHFCPTCGKGFFMLRHLREHKVIHLGLKPHICEHCGSAFTQKANLQKHVITAHFSHDRIFDCDKCPYKAKSIYSLKSHLRTHEMRERFICDVCEHSFVSKDGLKRHMWRHMGQKKFHCVTCSYSCYDASTLTSHCRKHTGERPFPCDLCDYRGKTKERLKDHMKSHRNEQTYACQHCPYTANYRYNLVRHLRTNCDRNTRNYTRRKNKAAIDISLIEMRRGSDANINATESTNNITAMSESTTSNSSNILLNNSAVKMK